MGARMLRTLVEQPLISREEILRRQNAIEEAEHELYQPRGAVRISESDLRSRTSDRRISYRTANPRDLIAFGNSLAMLPYIKQILKEFSGELLKNLEAALDPLADLKELIDKAIVEEPPDHGARGRHHQGRLP